MHQHRSLPHFFLYFSCLLISMSVLCVFFPATAQADTPSVNIWLTTTDGQNKLTPQNSVNFNAGSGTNTDAVNVDDTQQFQQMDGFGAAMTDTSAYLIGTKMSASQRDSVMNALFSSTDGIGVSFVRIPMGSSDYTATPPDNPGTYSYDDLPSDHTDPSLTHFSISHDTTYIIPVLK